MNDHQSQALTETDVAKQLGLSVATLRAWRLKRKGPRFVRFGRAVRYLAADVDRFIESSLVWNDAKRAGDTELSPSTTCSRGTGATRRLIPCGL